MPKDNSRTIAIYSRKSKFTGKGESIENQIELCRQYISSRYSREEAAAAIVYEDEGFSGGNTDRPRFRQMMSDAREKKISAVVCYRLDRVSRNISDFSVLIRELERLGISFISIREDFDTRSPMGRAMMYIASVFSQLERETIAERIRDNMHELAKTGRWLGGTTPTGYASESVSHVTVDGKSKKACKLSLIETEAETVRLIFSKFLETGSLTQTDTFLLQNRITTKNGRDFTRFAIKNILTNPVYMIADEAAYKYLSESGAELFSDKSDFDGVRGIMAYNRTEQKHGEAHKIRPEDEWIVAVGKHPGIISGSDWIKVQTCLDQNRSKSFRRTRSNTALLSGLLLCGSCGDYMRPKLTKRTNKDGELVYAYLCNTKERSRSERCAIPNISGNLLDRIVCTELKKLSEDGSAFVKSVEKAKKDILSDKGDFSENVAELKKSFSENEKAIENLTKALSENSESSAAGYIIKEIENLHKKNDGLRSQIDELENIRKRQILNGGEFDVLRDMLSSFAETMDIMSTEQKRAAIRACVRKIVWDGENIHIYLYGSDDGDTVNTLEIPLSEYSK